MKKCIASNIIIIVAMAITTITQAQQADLDSKIIAIDSGEPGRHQCSDNAGAMSACRSFIKGFIQGALLTDTAIIESIEKIESSYAERAIRTRLGTRATSPTALAGFCLPDDRTVLELAEETLEHVKDSKRNSVELAENVYRSLKVDYPCD